MILSDNEEPERNIRVLIISRTPWDDSMGLGNTMTNLFDGIEGVDFFNLCCQHGQVNNHVAKKNFQFTDKSVLISAFKRIDAGKLIENQKNVSSEDKSPILGKNYSKIAAQHLTLSLIARDFIWLLGRWKNSNNLQNFLAETKPDIVYLPIYPSWYMCNVQNYLISLLKVPVVGHLSDDVYNYPKGYLVSPFVLFYKSLLRKKLRKLIGSCSYLEVFADNMKREYGRLFRKPCYLIGKGLDFATCPIETFIDLNKKDIEFVYTGNIGNGRYLSLYLIGRALDGLNSYKRSTLRIYSASNVTHAMKKKFSMCSSIRFMGAIDSQKVREVQRQADVLVHVESFKTKDICETRMSLSTKIIDYLCTGRLLFAVGSKEVNSIEFLETNGLAIVASKESEISDKLQKILSGQINFTKMIESTRRYMSENRNIHLIQNGIKDRMKEVLKTR